MPLRPAGPQSSRWLPALRSVPRVAGRARARLRDSVLPMFAAAGLGLAGVWVVAPYASVLPAIFAPQHVLVVLVRDAVQNYGADCTRSNGRRCGSRQEAEPDPPYAPLERAVRKVLRHAGVGALLIERR